MTEGETINVYIYTLRWKLFGIVIIEWDRNTKKGMNRIEGEKQRKKGRNPSSYLEREKEETKETWNIYSEGDSVHDY